MTALSDLRALRGHSLRESIGELGGPLLRERMECLEAHMDGALHNLVIPVVLPFSKGGVTGEKLQSLDVSQGKGRLRVLRPIADKEGKSRVIAIGDFWSQCALLPLHKCMFRILRRIPQDMTFSQGAFVEKLTAKGVLGTNAGGSVTLHSVDLSKATDRFPMPLIFELLRYVLGTKRALTWWRVMVSEPFLVNPSSQQRGLGGIHYRAGNPMGFYSSWASFALAHHAILWMIGRQVLPDLKFKDLPYVLLGDDILIYHDGLADAYKSFLTSAGVE